MAMEAVSNDGMARLAERQAWITDQAQERAQGMIAGSLRAVGGEGWRDLLHGDWLHEPLHAVLTDVPVGAWTAAVAFDAIGAVTGGDGLNKAADASVVVGLVGAVGAAITGMNDWADVKEDAPRRIGAVHALLNVAATGVFAASCVARSRDQRSKGRGLAAIGFLLVSASAHLGGNLVYEHGLGVERSKPEPEVKAAKTDSGSDAGPAKPRRKPASRVAKDEPPAAPRRRRTVRDA